MDPHELRELLDTADSGQQRHERRVGATVDSRMQAGSDDADEVQPPDEVLVHCRTGTSDGGGAHVDVRSDAQEHTGQDDAQDFAEVRSATEDSGCLLGLDGTGEHRGVAAAIRRQAAERQGQATDGVVGPG